MNDYPIRVRFRDGSEFLLCEDGTVISPDGVHTPPDKPAHATSWSLPPEREET